MHSDCLPFSNIPHTSRLFLDFLSYSGHVPEFYPRSPQIAQWAVDEAKTIQYDPERRKAVADILERQNKRWGSGTKTETNLQKFRDGAAVVVGGQQVGVFGGPLFVILKALTAVATAERAEAAGVPAVPVFWLATEDHDLAEVSRISVPKVDGSLEVIDVAPQAVEDAPVGDVRFGDEITAQVEKLTELLGPSDITDAITEAYRPGVSMGDAFANLYAKVFAEWGVILIDAYDPEFHRIAAPIYRAAAENADELDHLLLERGKALEHAGYHQQVKVTSSSTQLFVIVDGRRTVLQRSNGGFKAGTHRYSAEELLEQISAGPENFSANVLLRPVVQDYLLPTLAYVGGPSEVAYFAQVAVVYQKLLGRITPVLPRFSATIVSQKSAKFLAKYGVKLPDLFHGSDRLKEILASRVLSVSLQTRLQSADAAIHSAMERIAADLETLDPTLVRAAAKAEAKMRYQLSRLGGRAARAEFHRNEVVAHHAEGLSTHLFPHKNLQEREIAGVYFLAQHGPDLLNELCSAARHECPDHQVLYL